MADGDRTVELDRAGPVWTGVFPGLGEVRIDADGALAVHCESDDPGAEAALRHGWGELLSLAHQGARFLNGTAVAPADGEPAALLTGGLEPVGAVTAELARSGWTVVGDRLTPADLDGPDIVVRPRPGPVLGRRRTVRPTDREDPTEPDDTEWARGDTDVVVSGFQQATGPSRLSALVEVGHWRVGLPDVEELTGHDRFALASGLLVLGALRPRRPDEETGPTTGVAAAGEDAARPEPRDLLVDDHLRLAALPTLRIRVADDAEGAARRVATWFTDRGPV